MDRYDIAAALKRRGITQADIARRCGVTPTLVGYVITGERKSPRIRRAIAKSLDLPASALWPEAKERTA